MAMILPAVANAELRLNVVTTDGADHSFLTSHLVMSVENDKLCISNDDAKEEFSLSGLSKMYFTTVESVEEFPVLMVGNDAVQVYSLDGLFMGKYDSLNEAVATLPAGIYMFKTTNGTLKISLK
ncbi:MAG: hypothetical protein NC194_05260 [Prevotella sp.]|nr:hypothetical protein [Prevotella sp.]